MHVRKECGQDCEKCLDLIDEYGIENLEICERCGHYFVQYRDNSGFCKCIENGMGE